MMAPTIAPIALIPSQSATRRSPGLPARASRFSVRSENDVLVTRETPARQARGQRTQGPLDERLLELEVLEVLGLHRPELGQPCLDRVDGRAAGEPDEDQEDGAGRERGEMSVGMGIGLDLDVDDLADEHEPDEHHDPADDEDDDAARQAR